MLLILVPLLLYASLVLAVPKNVSIDDAFGGDSKTSLKYFPDGAWIASNALNHGRVAPDMARAHEGTWHDTTQDSELDKEQAYMELTFEGTGVFIYCIIPNALDEFTGVKANYTFFMDNEPDGTYLHERDRSLADQYIYNVPVYHRTGMRYAKHTFRLVPIGGANVAGSSVVLFDNAVISTDDGAPATTTSSQQAGQTNVAGSTAQGAASPQVPLAAIIGGVVGGIVFLLIIIFFVFMWYTRRRRRRTAGPSEYYSDPESRAQSTVLASQFSAPYTGGPPSHYHDGPTMAMPLPPGPPSILSSSNLQSSDMSASQEKAALALSDMQSVSGSSSSGSGSRSRSDRPERDSLVQNLRREVEQLRARVLQDEAPPPTYQA